ncbi:MAG: CvpA family protein [Treponema sp.]|nr:CvpA family protein [Treponema sp.]
MMLSIIDVIFILIILIFTIIATAKGFVSELFNKISFIGGIIVGCMFCNKLSAALSNTIKNPLMSKIVSFILLFIITFLLIQIIKVIIGRFFDSEIMSGLDRTMGFFFGIIEGMAVVLFILWILSNFPFLVDSLLQNSIFFRFFAPVLTIKPSSPGVSA